MNDDFIIPRLRQDLEYFVEIDEGERYVHLYDSEGLAPQPVAFPETILPLLKIIDGNIRKSELSVLLKNEVGENYEQVLIPFLDFMNLLDEMYFLESPRLFVKKIDHENYLNLSVRPPVCSGGSYPDNPHELKMMLARMESAGGNSNTGHQPKGLVIPHIDFRVGEGANKCYSLAYNTLRQTEADLFVILGTSHYANTGKFMFTGKDFATPLGLVKNDIDLFHQLERRLSFKPKIDEIAHRYEHSLELQLVWLQHIFGNTQFSVLPILTGSFLDFIQSGSTPSSDAEFSDFIKCLDQTIEDSGRKAVYIASADLSHIGRKFGDDFDAEQKFEQLKLQDEVLINHLLNCDSEGFFSEVASTGDKWRICGLSPVYSLLQLTKPQKSKYLNYHIWSETETKSAVSFASLVYY